MGKKTHERPLIVTFASVQERGENANYSAYCNVTDIN